MEKKVVLRACALLLFLSQNWLLLLLTQRLSLPHFKTEARPPSCRQTVSCPYPVDCPSGFLPISSSREGEGCYYSVLLPNPDTLVIPLTPHSLLQAFLSRYPICTIIEPLPHHRWKLQTSSSVNIPNPGVIRLAQLSSHLCCIQNDITTPLPDKTVGSTTEISFPALVAKPNSAWRKQNMKLQGKSCLFLYKMHTHRNSDLSEFEVSSGVLGINDAREESGP